MKMKMEGVKSGGKGKKRDGGNGEEGREEMSELLKACRRDLERLEVKEGEGEGRESEGEDIEEGEETTMTPTESMDGEGGATQ